jgi:hypothetical protein
MTETIFQRSIELKASQTNNIPSLISPWWKETSKDSGTVASAGKLYAIGNYLIQLVKNSLGDGKSDGKVTASFDGEKIKIIIEDFSSQEKEINLNVAGDYGMKESIEYFDVFTVESKGRMYEKNRRNMLEETDDSDLYAGSKVTLLKYHVTPADEIQEEYHSNRNFGARM